jgi:ankyrin repeat protein
MVLDSSRAELDIRDPRNKTGLMLAALSGHRACVKLWCERKVDVDARHKEAGMTALVMATSKLHRDCMYVLLDNCACSGMGIYIS